MFRLASSADNSGLHFRELIHYRRVFGARRSRVGKDGPRGTTWKRRTRIRCLIVLAAAAALAVSAGAAWGQAAGAGQPDGAAASAYVPPLWAAAPFVLLLLAIAIVPLVGRCAKFWHRNRNKLLVALVLSAPVLLYYFAVHSSMAVGEGGQPVELAAGLLKRLEGAC